MTTHIQEVECRLHHHMNLHLAFNILRQGKAIGQTGLPHGVGIWCQGHRTACTAVIGIDAPLGTLGCRSTIVMLCLHSYIAVSGGCEGVTARRRIDGNIGSPGQHILAEVVVPRGIADMLLNHHTVPLAISHDLIIILAQLGITTESFFHLLRPSIGIGQACLSCILVHGLRIVHIIEIGHSLHGEQQYLTESITRSLGHILPKAQHTGFQCHIVVTNTLPLARLDVISPGIQHLWRYTCHILAVLIVDVGSLSDGFLGGRTTEHSSKESLCMVCAVLLRIFLRIPRHIHKQRNRILHGFQVTHVQNPHTLNAVVVGQRELFEHLLGLGNVQPLRVTWCAHIVDMVVQSPAPLVLTFLGIGYTAHITPVVVTQQHDDVVGHTHAGIIVVEYFLIECPHLRRLFSRLLGHLLDNLTLVLHNLLQQLGIGFGTHGLVTVTTHTDGHHILGTLHTLNTLAEELVEFLLVFLIVPRAPLATLAGILLMIASHRLVVRGTHDNTHLISCL